MGGRSGGTTAKGKRFQKGSGRMGTVAEVDRWSSTSHGDYRNVIIGSATNPTGAWDGGGSIEAFETRAGYRGEPYPFLTVSATNALNRSDRGKGIGMGMYLTALKFAQDNNVGFRSDTTVSPLARNVWNALAARGVNVQRDRNSAAGSHFVTILPEDVQKVDIASLNRQRRTG